MATAIFTARSASGAYVLCLDGARRIGAKILVSGGSRCNVTNRIVTERDFWGGSSRVVRSLPARSQRRRVSTLTPSARAASPRLRSGICLSIA